MSSLKDYFSFNRSERRGILVLTFILLLIIASPYFFSLYKSSTPTDFSAFEKEIAAFETKKNHHSDSLKFSKGNHIQRNIILFEFNPNNLPAEQWKSLGLSDKQINVIKHYESKGGRFFKKEDLKKIYSITDSDYKRLEPYIIFPEKSSKKTNPLYSKNLNTNPSTNIELNSADSVKLVSIKAIAPWLAKSILKYKSLLGGYASKEQLLEVYHLDTSKYDKIKNYFSVDKNLIKKINLNTATFKQLNNHPYIKYEIASWIVNYRQKHGKFKTMDELKNSGILSTDKFEKLLPYISIE